LGARTRLRVGRGRDIALRCPRPRPAGGTIIAVRRSYGGRCAAGRGADGAARRPHPAKRRPFGWASLALATPRFQLPRKSQIANRKILAKRGLTSGWNWELMGAVGRRWE